MIEPLLLSVTQILTFSGANPLTQASGFFFSREGHLFLVSSRHVFYDAPSLHFPDRIEITLHTHADNATQSRSLSIPLYLDQRGLWHQCKAKNQEVDVAVIEVGQVDLALTNLPAFTPSHLQHTLNDIQVGHPLLIVGFPLGFHDALHHLPVVRQAMIASSFGLRFDGKGMFITDARMHRGTSGAPVVIRASATDTACSRLPWKLLGVHSTRLDIGSRDHLQDESLGLNVAWYADVLMHLTEEAIHTTPVYSNLV